MKDKLNLKKSEVKQQWKRIIGPAKKKRALTLVHERKRKT